MRIGFVTDNLPFETRVGGIGTYCRIVARELNRRQVEVHVFRAVAPGGRYERFTEDGVHYHMCPKFLSIRKESVAGGALVRLIRAFNPTLAECVALRHFLKREVRNGRFDLIEFPEYGAWGHAARGLRGVARVAVRLHSSSWLCRSLAGSTRDVSLQTIDRLEASATLRAAVVTSPTRANWKLTEEGWNRPIPNVRIVPNPIEPELRHEGETRDNRMVVYTGRLERRKGIRDLAEAIPFVLRQVPDAKFKLVGHDTRWPDGKMGSEVVKEVLARANVVGNSVELIGGRPRAEALAYVRKARVAVVPSLYESFSITAAEAMALGTPLVTSDMAALREVVLTEDEGLSFPIGQPEELARRIVKLLVCQATWEKVQRAALNRVNDYRVESVVDQLLAAWGLSPPTTARTRETCLASR